MIAGSLSISSPQRHVTLRPNSLAPRKAREVVRAVCVAADVPRSAGENAAAVTGALVTDLLRVTAGLVTLRVSAEPDAVHVLLTGTAPNPRRAAVSVGALRCWDVVRHLSSSYGYRCTGAARELWSDVSAY